MTRKRFIKLVMSKGFDRNYSECLAGFIQGWIPYGNAWRNELFRMFWID